MRNISNYLVPVREDPVFMRKTVLNRKETNLGKRTGGLNADQVQMLGDDHHSFPL